VKDINNTDRDLDLRSSSWVGGCLQLKRMNMMMLAVKTTYAGAVIVNSKLSRLMLLSVIVQLTIFFVVQQEY